MSKVIITPDKAASAAFTDTFLEVHGQVTMPSEGGISNDPDDRGGLTCYGVSYAFLKGLSIERPDLVRGMGLPIPVTTLAMMKVTREIACKLFHEVFWLTPNLHQLHAPLACDCYDIGVNMGVRQGVKFLQASLNKLHKAGLAADGIAGPKTVAAQKKLKGSALLSVHEAIIASQKLRYNNIAKVNPSQKKFLKGWLNRSQRLDSFVREKYFNENK